MNTSIFNFYGIADIDECAQGIDGCDQMCINENGSYSCSCGTGYHLSSDRHGCDDINECALGTDGCEQICTNTIGSYVCSCDTGYFLANDGKLCNGQSTNILCLLLSKILNNPATFFLQIQMNVPMTQIVVLKHA